MDRFIGNYRVRIATLEADLKSNMDRFIGMCIAALWTSFIKFKIQYGQIYRHSSLIYAIYDKYLKSNMDRFIEIKSKVTKPRI